MTNFNFMGSWVPSFNQAVESEVTFREQHPSFTTFQLATIGSNGFPKNRTLVYRGFLFDDKATNVLTATIDTRLQKYIELSHNDKFEAVFWFERLKKQFRFSGRARFLDQNYSPKLDLSKIQPKRMLEDLMLLKAAHNDENHEDSTLPGLLRSNIPLAMASPLKQTVLSSKKPTIQHDSMKMKILLESVEDSQALSDDEDDVGLEICAEHKCTNQEANYLDDFNTPSVQKQPLSSCLCSPSLFHKISQASGDLSFTNLHDMSQFLYYPPTDQEWKDELARHWNIMTKNLKKSFRKPPPCSPMTGVHQKTIDLIARGVDGKKEEAGLENFTVLALFVDRVDLLELDKDRRYIFEKDENHQWEEFEVCP